jgi:large subunit ribosomal protein L32e
MEEIKTTPKKRPKFLRRKNKAYSKLGKGRKKKQIWRRPTGRDNKMREKRRGVPAVVSVGYKTAKKDVEKSVVIMNLNDLKNVKEGIKIIVGKIGNKKKVDIAKYAKEKKVELSNLNVEKFLKKIEKAEKIKKEAKKKVETKKEKKEKKGTQKEESKAPQSSVPSAESKVKQEKENDKPKN